MIYEPKPGLSFARIALRVRMRSSTDRVAIDDPVKLADESAGFFVCQIKVHDPDMGCDVQNRPVGSPSLGKHRTTLPNGRRDRARLSGEKPPDACRSQRLAATYKAS